MAVKKSSRLLALAALACVGAASLLLGGCGGHVDDDLDDDDLIVSEIDSTSDALTSPAAGSDSADDDGAPEGKRGRGDGDCNEHDREGHKHHLRHKFKILDRLDGAKDKQIVIASLPPGLPDRLVAKLHVLDADADGVVTRDELKAALHARKHRHRRDKD